MYTPLALHTHYSLLRGLSKPDALVESLASKNIGSAAITDFDKLSGVVAFSEACVKAGIKPILGSKIYIRDDGGYVTVIAKNKIGWRELSSISSLSHDKNHIVKDVPSIFFHELGSCKNVLVMAGEPDSIVANAIVAKQLAYTNKNPLQYSSYFLHTDYATTVKNLLEKYKSTFGENFILTLQKMNLSACPIDGVVADTIEYYAEMYGIKCVAVPNSYYLNKCDKFDHNLLICSHNKFHFNQLATSIETEQYANLNRFVNDDNCHLPTFEEMSQIYSESTLKNSMLVSDMCESYTILANPTLPAFDCPNGMSQKEYLRQLCREGWKRLSSKLDLGRTKEYVERIEQELGVFNEANLEGYFLIVQDYVRWAKSQGQLVGCGRGSAGGCLVSYLLDITTIDPVVYELYFERFYNKGRNAPGKVSLPDIDTDFPVAFRERVFEYISKKYGEENVSQVCTFSSLQGRGAIKQVLRVHNACNNDTMNDISKRIPQTQEIADKLEEAKENSVIRWTLHNDPDALKEWVTMSDDGVVSGYMKDYFEQAIRIEGTYKSYGKHASALVIGSTRIADVCPMVNDKKTGALIAGLEYEFAEKTGVPKWDILGLSTLDKLMGVNSLLRTGTLKTFEIEPQEVEDDE
jgi:DNA polymerase-3 subunit alpha